MNKYNLTQRVKVDLLGVEPDHPAEGAIERMWLRMGKVWYNVKFDKPLFDKPVFHNTSDLSVEENRITAI